MVPGWVGTSLLRTFRGDSSGQSILTCQVPGETDVLVWRRMVDYAARCGAGSWPQTALLGHHSRDVPSTSFGRETPDRGFCVIRDRRRYRYCRISFQTPPLDHGRRSGLSPSLVVRGIHKNPG